MTVDSGLAPREGTPYPEAFEPEEVRSEEADDQRDGHGSVGVRSSGQRPATPLVLGTES